MTAKLVNSAFHDGKTSFPQPNLSMRATGTSFPTVTKPGSSISLGLLPSQLFSFYPFKETKMDPLSRGLFGMFGLNSESWSVASITPHFTDYVRKCYLHFWILNSQNVGQLRWVSFFFFLRYVKLLNTLVKSLHWNQYEFEVTTSTVKKWSHCRLQTDWIHDIQANYFPSASALLSVNCDPKSNLGLLQVTTVSLEHKTYCMATLVSYNNYVIS